MIKSDILKRLTGIFLIVSFAFSFSCRENPNTDTEMIGADGASSIQFENKSHDFGRISEGETVACSFRFINDGVKDLIIKSATTSCGCTVPKFPERPISPGEGGLIEVMFDSSFRQGLQNKTITIRSNADKPVVILKITADIITNN